MVDDETADWFVSTEKRPITFERRIPEIMIPCMQEAGLEDMKPDLVVFSSLFWDESFIWRVSPSMFEVRRAMGTIEGGGRFVAD